LPFLAYCRLDFADKPTALGYGPEYAQAVKQSDHPMTQLSLCRAGTTTTLGQHGANGKKRRR